jgi:hypothetical protein
LFKFVLAGRGAKMAAACWWLLCLHHHPSRVG